MTHHLKSYVDNAITDKNTVHSYLDTYQELIGLRRETARNVLEIGIRMGGSIKLWADFFPNATVHGIDVMPPPTWLRSYPRVACHQGDAYHQSVIRMFESQGIRFDVIVDDGPHTLESMMFVAKYFYPLLSENGVLIIEDIQQPSWVQPILDAIPSEEAKMRARVVDLRHVKGRYDDMLVVIDRSKSDQLPF